jgi:hypothetical protein
MANTYIQIGSTVTVGAGGAANIDFTSIPSTYTDLILKMSTSTNNASYSDALMISFNGLTTNFTWRNLLGDGSTPASYNGTDTRSGVTNGSTATSVFGNAEMYIPNYAGSNNKSASIDAVAERNATSQYVDLNAKLWSNSAAINRITITPQNGSLFLQYSTASLYGILKS